MCFAEMLAFIAKQSPASFPAFFCLIFLSIALAWSIAFSFKERKMFRSLDFGVAIFFENWRRFSRAVNFPCWICFSLDFNILCLLFLLRIVCRVRLYVSIRRFLLGRAI